MAITIKGSTPSDAPAKKAKKAKKAEAKSNPDKPAPKAKKVARSKGKPTGDMPQRSAATKKGGARPSAKAVKYGKKTVIAEGLGVQAAWVSIFLANEILPKSSKMDDETIYKAMKEAFRGRETEAFKHVQRVRAKFNAGGFGDQPKASNRYDSEGNMLTPRGKPVAA